MLTNREVILAKIESVYNTDPTPTGVANAVLVEDPSWSLEGLRMIARNPVSTSLASRKQLFAGTLRQVSFQMEMKGPGAAYSASVLPEMDPLLRACGFAATLVTTGGSETVTYKPASSGIESATIYYYQDGLLQILTGCRGNVSFAMNVNDGRGMASFTMTGHSVSSTDVALATPTYDSTVPPPVINGSFTVDSYGAVIDGLTFDMSNTVATPPDLNAVDGYSQVYITKRDVNGSISPERVLVATEAFEANLRSGAAMALTTGVIGADQYNRYTVSMPAISYRNITPGDRDGVGIYTLPFGADISTGDDEVSILFT